MTRKQFCTCSLQVLTFGLKCFEPCLDEHMGVNPMGMIWRADHSRTTEHQICTQSSIKERERWEHNGMYFDEKDRDVLEVNFVG